MLVSHVNVLDTLTPKDLASLNYLGWGKEDLHPKAWKCEAWTTKMNKDGEKEERIYKRTFN